MQHGSMSHITIMIVYQAEVKKENDIIMQSTEYYVGLTDTEFKLRLANHKHSFNKQSENAAELSKHVWSIKDKYNLQYHLGYSRQCIII